MNDYCIKKRCRLVCTAYVTITVINSTIRSCERRSFMDTPSILPEEEILYDLADFFKVFGDSTRIKILYTLMDAEYCVNDLAAALSMNQSAVSHQLKILKQSKLVRYRREGKAIFYSLADEHVVTIIDQGLSHIAE